MTHPFETPFDAVVIPQTPTERVQYGTRTDPSPPLVLSSSLETGGVVVRPESLETRRVSRRIGRRRLPVLEDLMGVGEVLHRTLLDPLDLSHLLRRTHLPYFIPRMVRSCD